LAMSILVATTLILLFLMTGSVLLPFKALIMNLLTLGAAVGLMVLVFQDGRLEGLIGYRSQGGIQISILVLVFIAGFGLSTDYGVFGLSRIREAYYNGASNEEAVALGLERTGRLVTSAALLFAVATGALMVGSLIGVKEIGFGVAAAVLIDAMIVRGLLVPSLMALLGERNWWAPKQLGSLAAKPHA
ncbi:MAG: MMPL family transporter, partial [Solirubrobacterales bacterium]